MPDQLVADLLLFLVDQRHGRAEHHLVARQGGRIDHQRTRQSVLKVGEHCLDLALAFLGRMIFGVFAQIAMRARFLDRIDDPRPLEFEPLDLVGHGAEAFFQHRHLVARHGRYPFAKPAPAPALQAALDKANCLKISLSRLNNRTVTSGLQAGARAAPRSRWRRRRWPAPW